MGPVSPSATLRRRQHPYLSHGASHGGQEARRAAYSASTAPSVRRGLRRGQDALLAAGTYWSRQCGICPYAAAVAAAPHILAAAPQRISSRNPWSRRRRQARPQLWPPSPRRSRRTRANLNPPSRPLLRSRTTLRQRNLAPIPSSPIRIIRLGFWPRRLRNNSSRPRRLPSRQRSGLRRQKAKGLCRLAKPLPSFPPDLQAQ